LSAKVVEGLKETASLKNIKIKIERPKELLSPIMVDKEKIGIAVQNLVDNAIKYTPAGGKVTITLSKNGNQAFFKIADSGVGIPQDQQDRIFSKFFRGSNVVRLETEGSGLGLYTTKNIIESHKGKIWFESKEGEGTTFTLLFLSPHRQFFKLGVKYKI